MPRRAHRRRTDSPPRTNTAQMTGHNRDASPGCRRPARVSLVDFLHDGQRLIGCESDKLAGLRLIGGQQIGTNWFHS